MKTLKSTLASFEANELEQSHKLKIKGGIPEDWIIGEPEYDEFGIPINNGIGPRGTGGTSSVATGSSLGNPIVIVVGQTSGN